jgi:tyrosine-protein kinase Etk/Wzc
MNEDQFFEEKPQSNIFVQVVHRYLPFWPVLLILTAISMSIAFVYLRSQTKIYVATTRVLLKDPQKGGGDSKVLDALNIFSEKKIVDNELIVLKSSSLKQEVVKQLDLYATIYNKGKVQLEELYGTNSPLTFVALNKDSATINGGGRYELDIDWAGNKIKLNNILYDFNAIVPLNCN